MRQARGVSQVDKALRSLAWNLEWKRSLEMGRAVSPIWLRLDEYDFELPRVLRAP